MGPERLWNANVQYHALLLKALPRDARHVLDVGCGDGLLCADLVRAGVAEVVGLDADAGVLGRAKARFSGAAIEWIHGDVLSAPIERAGAFDAVLSVATLHHMDAAAGLAHFAQLVRPGGVVGVIGLAANDWWDLPLAAAGYCAKTAMGGVRGRWEHSAPMVWPPPATYREMKNIATRVLPGVRYRRHLLSRYSLIWTKPD